MTKEDSIAGNSDIFEYFNNSEQSRPTMTPMSKETVKTMKKVPMPTNIVRKVRTSPWNCDSVL